MSEKTERPSTTQPEPSTGGTRLPEPVRQRAVALVKDVGLAQAARRLGVSRQALTGALSEACEIRRGTAALIAAAFADEAGRSVRVA